MLKTGEIANWIMGCVVLKTQSNLYFILQRYVDVKHRRKSIENTEFKLDKLRKSLYTLGLKQSPNGPFISHIDPDLGSPHGGRAFTMHRKINPLGAETANLKNSNCPVWHPVYRVLLWQPKLRQYLS